MDSKLKGNIIFWGLVAICLIWSVLLPRADNETNIKLAATTSELTQKIDNRTATEHDFTETLHNIKDLKKASSGRGNKAVIDYSYRFIELTQKTLFEEGVSAKIHDNKFLKIAGDYFSETFEEMEQKKVMGLEFDNLLLWIYTHVLL